MRSGWLLGSVALSLAAALGWETLRAPDERRSTDPPASEPAPALSDADWSAPAPETGPAPSPGGGPAPAPAPGSRVEPGPAPPRLVPRDPTPPPWVDARLRPESLPIPAPNAGPGPTPAPESGPAGESAEPPARTATLAEMLTLEIWTDEPSLPPGAPLQIRARLRNISSRPVTIVTPLDMHQYGIRIVRYYLRAEDERGRNRTFGHTYDGPWPGEAIGPDDLVELKPGDTFDCDPGWQENGVAMKRAGRYLLRATYFAHKPTSEQVMSPWGRTVMPRRAAEIGLTAERAKELLDRVDQGHVESNVLVITRLP